MDEVFSILKEAGVPALTAVVSWFLAKRKYNAEVDNSIIHNMKESLEFYKQVSDDNKARLQETESENKRLREQIRDMNDEVRQLREQVDYLTRFVCTNIACNDRQSKIKASKQGDTAKKINNK